MTDKLSERMYRAAIHRSSTDQDVEEWADEVTALEQRVEHFERFKLYLSVMGGIDVDHAWEATEREEEE